MTAGLLKTRCDLVNVGRVADGAGGWTRADGVEASVWGALRNSSYSRQERGEKLEQRATHSITIRWTPSLAQSFGPESRVRIVDGGGHVRTFAVLTVADPDNRRRFLELSCREGGPE